MSTCTQNYFTNLMKVDYSTVRIRCISKIFNSIIKTLLEIKMAKLWKFISQFFFIDPRYWTRNDVATWLQYMESEHQLPAIRMDRFFMNGKALCLMTSGMFLDRVPIGGKLLYKDFQLRLARAMYNIELYHSWNFVPSSRLPSARSL